MSRYTCDPTDLVEYGVGRHVPLANRMELRHLRYLIAVAEELNFGRAAIRLRISQPPLSQQIRQLEEELGVRLFDRTKRQVKLTEAGKLFVVEAQQILSQVDHFVSLASRIGEGTIGRLTVAGQAVLNEVLVQTLRVFAQQYPGVHIELQFMNTALQIEALREGHVHVGFLHLPVDDSHLTLEPIKREPLWLALPKGHPLAQQKRVALTSLAHQPFIMFARRSSTGLHDVITTACRNAGFSLNVVHEVDNVIASMTLVTAGLGLAFCSPSWRKLWPDIAFRPFLEPVPALEYAVAYRSGAQSPTLESFLKVVRRIARQNSRRI
jgi:DNA-binding transcriptional LysR family regulator